MISTGANTWSAPVIIVGAGRSGTTRLAATLGAHRDLHMIGETSFLLPRLWATFHERRDFSRKWRIGKLAQQTRAEWRAMSWWRFWQGELGRDLETLGPTLADIESSETVRLQRTFGAFLAEVMIPPTLRTRRWGFKEIWAGGDAFPYSWDLYHGAFPEALFVQSIRHPLDYLRSIVAHGRHADPADDMSAHTLEQWVRMVRHGRALRETGRYYEFRMEAFDSELPKVLHFLGLDPDPACAEAGGLKYLPSPEREVVVAPAVLDRVEGLHALCEELGFDLRRPPSQSAA